VQSYGGYAGEGTVLLVTELLDCNLYEFLRNRTIMDLGSKIKLAMDIAEGMAFLHSRNIIHRDLKSVNVLLSLSDPITAKVCDFGLSRVMDTTCKMTGNVGTVAWIAPEVFQNKKYSEKCDIYSYGVILYELMTHLIPFKEVNAFRIPSAVVKGQRPAFPPNMSQLAPKAYIELMKACWNPNPQKRPSFVQILQRLGDMATPIPMDNLEDVNNRQKWSEYSSEDSDTSESSLTTSTATSVNIAELEKSTLIELTVMLQVKRIKSQLINDDLKLKCLRSRKYHVRAARKTVEWYIQFVKYYTHDQPITIASVRKAFDFGIMTVYGGVDVDGGPILYFNCTKHFVETLPAFDLVRAWLYCLDRVNDQPNAFSQGITCLLNMGNWTMKNYSMKFYKTLASIFNQYPYVCKHILCVDSPWWMSKMWTIFSNMIGKTLWMKMRIIDRNTLAEYISSDHLLPELGGTFDFDLNQWLRSRYETEKIEYIP